MGVFSVEVAMIRNIEAFVKGICKRTLWDGLSREEQEDACHDAMVAALDARLRADPEKGNADALIAQRVKGAILDYLRTKQRQKIVYGYQDMESTPKPVERTIESRLTQKTLTLQVKTMLYALDKRKRQAVNYYYLKGMSIHETARRMKTSTSTAWRLIKTGVEELQDSVAEYHPVGVNWKC